MNPWFRMANEAAFLMWDAPLRFMRMAAGGPWASSEVETSVDQNAASLAESQVVGRAAAGGKSSPAIGEKLVRVHKKRVKGNQRRISKR